MRLALVCVLALTTTASAKRAFQLEDLYRVKSVAGFTRSGKTIVYGVVASDLARAKRQTHLWAMADDGGNPRQLTFGDASELEPTISPDGKQLAFIRGDQLYVMALDGGEARKVTD